MEFAFMNRNNEAVTEEVLKELGLISKDIIKAENMHLQQDPMMFNVLENCR